MIVIKRHWYSKMFHLVLGVLLMMAVLDRCNGESGPAAGEPGSFTVSAANSRGINPTAYGQNYWDWVPSYSNGIPGTESRMADLHINVYRAGGTYNDLQLTNRNPDKWDNSQVDKYLAYCRTIQAEPLLQIPINPDASDSQNAAEAAKWAIYCKGKVKYWIIGNEPDLYPKYSIQKYINVFNSCATAIKAVDMTNMIIGPEICSHYEWIAPFLEACKDNVDIVSFHYYPFGKKGDFTVRNVLGNGTAVGDLIRKIKNNIQSYDKPLALTEAHVSWSSVTGEAASAETFYAGLWIADTAGISLSENLWTAAFWCTCGGYGTGFLDVSTKKPLPAYYALQMFTTRFGSRLISVHQVPSGLSVYASRNTENNRTILIVINKTNKNQPETIRFSDFETSIPERTYTFPAYSITSLSIPDDDEAMECWSYTKSLAGKGAPPQYRIIE
jgi:hypothetical protein